MSTGNGGAVGEQVDETGVAEETGKFKKDFASLALSTVNFSTICSEQMHA